MESRFTEHDTGRCTNAHEPVKSRSRFTQVLFMVLFCVVLAGPLLLFAGQRVAHLPLPSWLTSEDASYLIGGVVDADVPSALSVSGFASGQLQQAIEDEISCYIPTKAIAMLSNAELQRDLIAGSAFLTSMDCYPTYFGSRYYFEPEYDALQEKWMQVNPALEEQLSTFADGFADVAEAFPDTEFVLVIADGSNSSEANAGYGLESDIFTTSMAYDFFRSSCAGLPNVFLAETTYADPEEFYRDFYRTDHHWNGWGTVASYRKAVEAFGDDAELLRSPFQDLSDLPGFDWLKENGYASRAGLMMLNESVDEPLFHLEGLKITNGAKRPPVLCRDGEEMMREAGPMASYNFYETWYGSSEESVVENGSAVFPDRRALIVGDSFATSFKWLASTGFGTVTTSYDLHNQTADATPLASAIRQTQPDVVFVVAREMDIRMTLEHSPEYLSL